jgi:hypothetical protein
MNELARYDGVPTEKLRDSVMDDLVKHYSLERISLEEFERRTELVSKASARGELLAQVADLPALSAAGGERRPGPSSATRGGWRIASSDVRQSDVSVAIFGGSDIKGAWRAPRRLAALCVFGGSSIDLRKAIVPAEGVTISCVCAFGGADIIVPRGMRVQVRGMGIFGGFDRTNNEVDDPDAPTIVVEGIAVFGGVSVRIKD